MWAISASVWDFESSVWVVAASVHAAQALCGLSKTNKNTKSLNSAVVQAFQVEEKIKRGKKVCPVSEA